MRISKDNGSVSICKGDSECNMRNSFIDIWVDDEGDFPSPFKSIKDAELFAEMIVKLLEVVYNDIK